MLEFKSGKIKDKDYLCKVKGKNVKLIAVNHKGRYRTSINIPDFEGSDEQVVYKELTQKDIEQLGYTVSKNSSLQILNSNIRLDTSFILDNQSYIQNIEITKSMIESAVDKKKGLIIFENNGEFGRYLKNKDIKHNVYEKNSIKINYKDINEDILLEVLSLSRREKSIISSFMYYKEENKENSALGIPSLDGSQCIYDLLIMQPATIAQQYKVNEYEVKGLKTSVLKLEKNGMMSTEHSTVNEIIQKVENGKIVLIDVNNDDKKLLKLTLANQSKESISIVDNIYQKSEKLKYLLYGCGLYQGSLREFQAFILNKDSFYLSKDIQGMQYYTDELKFLDFEYLVLKEEAFPIIVTNEEYIKNNALKDITVNNTIMGSFF